MGGGGVAPLVLNLWCTRTLGKIPLNRRLGGPQKWSRSFGKKKGNQIAISQLIANQYTDLPSRHHLERRSNTGRKKSGLHPQSPRYFAWQHSARMAYTLEPSYLSHTIAANTQGGQYWHLHRSDCRNALIYAYSPGLWHQPGQANVTCAWSLRLCGINRAILKPYSEGSKFNSRPVFV